jgi:RNA polymerase sigma-70 factor, ECF subfamily
MNTPSDAVSNEPMPEPPDDDRLVRQIKGGDLAAFELLMRRHNQKLYRVVRSVLRDGTDVEDTMQDTYLAAFKHLHQFQGRARFSTWLLKIGINEALARVHRRIRVVDLDELSEERTPMDERSGPVRTPEDQAANHQLVAIVEAALDRLPPDFRQILMLRAVESLDTAEAADVLGLSEAAVKQRLHRARALLQEQLEGQIGGAMQSAFGFLGPRCDRVVAGVLRRIAAAT